MQKFVLTNLKTDEKHYYEAPDAQKEIVNMRFQLDMGIFPDKKLQKEYTETGLEVFRFDIIG